MEVEEQPPGLRPGADTVDAADTGQIELKTGIEHLEALEKRVKKCMDACREVVEKGQQGGEYEDKDEVAVQTLQLFVERFLTELKAYANQKIPEEMKHKMKDFFELQCDADELLVVLKVTGQKKRTEEKSSGTNSNSTSRLPKLELVTFDGDLMNWRRFWTRFHSAVDSRKDMSDGDKMTYLVGVLKNEAKQAIAGLDETDQNYTIAIDRLKERFGKPEHIIDAHYVALNKLAPATNDIRGCREVLDKVEQHLRVLETLGENTNKNNNLRSVIMDKFPENINYDLKMAIKIKGYSVENIRQSLEDIISAREANYPSSRDLKRPASEVTSFTTEALFSANQSSNGKYSSQPFAQRKIQDNRQPKKPRKDCIYCQGNHYHDECTKYTTVSERKQKLKNRCYICLGQAHNATNCRFKGKTCFHCKEGGHHCSLCPTRFKEKLEESTTLLSQSESATILQTLTANLYNEDSSRKTKGRLLFDTGSQKTYVSDKLARKLKLQPIEELCLTIFTFGQTRPRHVSTELVQIKVGKPNGGFIEITAHVIPNITGSIPSFQSIKSKIKQQYPNRLIADDAEEDSPADILIGNDQYHSFFTGTTEQICNHLHLVESKLGWIASGKLDDFDAIEVLSFLTYVRGERGKGYQQFSIPDPPLQDDNIRQLWDLESIGINESLKVMEEEEVIKFFNDTTQFHDGRYYVKWPWSQYPSDLPINYGLALGRLTGLLKRTDPNTLKLYDEVLQDQLSKGVIEIVNESKLPTSHPVHYLPHHHVMQENKTTKLRIVYDASAKVKGRCSLNEYLFKGPLMLEDLVTLILKFRTHPIGITADVEKAFLQVGLQEEDRDVTRFLWVKDTSKEPTEGNILQFRFCRVPFGIISSPYLLAAVVRHHLSLHHSAKGDKIAKDLYVDNLVTSTTSLEEALELYSTARTSFEGLSMNIREWNSNSEIFLSQVPNELKTKKMESTSVLGLSWNPEQDTLQLALNPDIILRKVSTKREILRIIASVFDPCGLVAPLLLPAKLFLQGLWVNKYRWDSPLPKEKVDDWYNEVAPFRYIKNVRVSRYYLNSKKQATLVAEQVELHCFTDASQDAYSTAVYIRNPSVNRSTVTLVMSRTKLTPVKQKELMTIPRLELLGVLIGTRLMKYIQRSLSLSVERMFLWTDSKIVLDWLKSSKLLPPFVSKRVSEINSIVGIVHRFVPTDQNPADIATRPVYTELPKMWFEGPSFLQQPVHEWPQEHAIFATIDSVMLPIQAEQIQPQFEDSIIEADESTDMDEPPASPEFDSSIDQENPELSFTENEKIKCIQQEHFPREMNGKTALTGSLGLFVDKHGLLRCQGRLQNADLPYDQKYPILLPKLGSFTLELIKKTHEDNHHVGVSHTLTLIRRRFWIPQGRSQVEKVIKKCPICVKYGGGPYKLPPMPPLPEERVRLCTPFTYIGLDYLGPLTVIESVQKQKRWVCLFTCMATRAIRLEVVKNLSAEEFLLCLRRFVAAQGSPLLIISDNAAQFKLAAEIIQPPFLETHKIAWHFIPELSPWQGGFYERMVGLVKHCLRRSLDKDLLSDSQLITILKEIETVLNSRPLTPVGRDLDCILTPSDFLPNCGTHPMIQPDGAGTPNSKITATKFELIEGWKRGQSLLQEFAAMFKNQYLACLRERSITAHKQHRVLAKREPKEGDIVQIWDGQSKPSHRACWKVGKIVTLIRSHDGLIRTAQVLLDSGVTLNRSISYLYPLEMENDRKDNNSEVLPQENRGPSNLDSTTNNDTQDLILTPLSNNASLTLLPRTASKGSEILEAPSSAGELETALDQPLDEKENSSSGRPRRRAAQVARKTIREWTQALIALNN